MSKSILIKPLLVLGGLLLLLVLLLLLIFGAFSGGDDEGGAAAGGDNVEQPESEPEPEPDRESSEGNIDAADLKVGDCISDANSRTGDVTTFEAVACDEPHDGEVYTLIRLEGGENAKPPSEAFINGKGQRGCRARLRRQATAKAFRDPQLGFKFVYPTPASWADGDRDITCVATFKKPRDKRLAQRSRD
ncbi:MAG: septum formation family protein [Solirubrobacteraceae bacterium]|nr:septum formation family protein [Solirubrobacteraceae bacterium]